MDTDSFVVYIKTDNIYKDIAEDVETVFGTSNCELDTRLPEEKNKKIIRLMKDKLGRKIMTKFDGSEDKKAEATKKCVIKKPSNLRVIKIVQKELNWRIKQSIQKKIAICGIKDNHKEFIKKQ